MPLQRCKSMLRHIGCFSHKLINPITQQSKSSQRGNGNDQPDDCCDECLIDAFGQVGGAGGTFGSFDAHRTR